MTVWASQVIGKMKLNGISITNLAHEMNRSRQMVSRTLNSNAQSENAMLKIEDALNRLIDNDTR